jgi:MoaA/NifB/PqqE/SkfB family radical SAM enzyme
MCSLNEKGGQHLQHNLSANEDIDYITNPTLTNLHLKLSNQCNLACRICESGCSNLLNTEDKLLINAGIRKEGLPKLNLRLDSNSVLMSSIKENIHNLNTLYISGGEPLLQEEVWEFLQLAFDKGHSKNIALQFNTNGTVKLSKERYDILKSFKKIDIMVSMDGIGKHADYIRTNSSWERWVENIKNYQQEFINYPNLRLSIILTVSMYNVHIVDKIVSFFADELKIQIDLNFVYEP